MACEALGVLQPIEHVYPERTVRLYPVECRYLGGPPRPIQVAQWAWVRPADLERYPFPPANESLLEALKRLGRT